MRAAVIFGLGCSPDNLRPFQTDHAIEWREEMPAATAQADIVLLFGGDGTLHRHLSQLVRLGLPVLIVPAGSGNDFARALGFVRVRDSLAAWRSFCEGRANVCAIDLGVIDAGIIDAGIIDPLTVAGPVPEVVAGFETATPEISQGTGRYFCSVAGVGLDAEVTRRANALPRWLRGHGGYAITLVPALFGFTPVTMKIVVEEKGCWNARSHQRTMLAAFANTPTYGGGMKIAPRAKTDDGKLDVCVIGGINRFKLACLFPTVYSGRHLSIREVMYFQASGVRVETEVPLDIYADGEYVCRTPAEITIRREALKVLTPAAAVLNSPND